MRLRRSSKTKILSTLAFLETRDGECFLFICSYKCARSISSIWKSCWVVLFNFFFNAVRYVLEGSVDCFSRLKWRQVRQQLSYFLRYLINNIPRLNSWEWTLRKLLLLKVLVRRVCTSFSFSIFNRTYLSFRLASGLHICAGDLLLCSGFWGKVYSNCFITCCCKSALQERLCVCVPLYPKFQLAVVWN